MGETRNRWRGRQRGEGIALSMVVESAGEAPRVLVVDDEEAVLDIVEEFLSLEGYVVKGVGSARQALQQIRFEPYDVMLTDLKMPGMDGLELIKEARATNPELSLVMMTGFGTVDTAIEAMKLGAFDYLLKPFKPDDVVEVLERALSKRRLERENVSLRETLNFFELSEALSSAMPLSQQLQMVVEMVRNNFGADGVSIDVQPPAGGEGVINRARVGGQGFELRHDALWADLLCGEEILLSGEQVGRYMLNPMGPGGRVQSFMATPLKLRGTTFGMLSAFSLDGGRSFSEGQRKGMSIFGGRAANAIETARMYQNMEDTFTQTMEGFARALEAKDRYTAGHSDRVAMYAKLIAQGMGLPTVEVDRIQHGGLMHDIGKIGMRGGELNKPQRLTPEEYEAFKTHPVKGRRIIEPISFLRHLVPCVYHHHEAWNGKGYPLGLDGEAIPLEARILAVADTYDAMTSNRSYRKGLPHDVALEELQRCAGRQFDPQVVDAFLDVITVFRSERISQGLSVPH